MKVEEEKKSSRGVSLDDMGEMLKAVLQDVVGTSEDQKASENDWTDLDSSQ